MTKTANDLKTVIRDAGETDLLRILAITNQAIVETTSTFNLTPTSLEARREWLAGRQAEGWPVLVGEVAGVVQGFGTFGPFRSWEGYRHTVEHSLYVDPAAQGRGLGTALLDALVERARETDVHVMVGGLEAGNAPSLALHRRAGFTETARLREVARKFDRWLDLVFVQKMLNDRREPPIRPNAGETGGGARSARTITSALVRRGGQRQRRQ